MRPHDDADLGALLGYIDATQLTRAHTAVGWIQARGYARGKDLARDLDEQLRRWSAPSRS